MGGAIAAFCIAVVGTQAIERFARRRALYDEPSDRRTHPSPTPRLGGAAIAAGTLGGVLLSSGGMNNEALLILAGGGALLAIGLADDLHELAVAPRYVIQTAVSIVTALMLAPELRVDLPFASAVITGPAAVVVVTLWLTATINIFNFMDGIDGMVAGGTAAMLPALIVVGGTAGGVIALPLAAACLGFLVWNYHPASIFMGDGGSQFLGYMVGTSLLLAPGEAQMVPAVLAFAPFIVDTSATLARRAASRKNLVEAHTEHFYQRLVRRGLSQRSVSTAYVIAVLGCGILAMRYTAATDTVQAGLLAVPLGFWLAVLLFGSRIGGTGTGRM